MRHRNFDKEAPEYAEGFVFSDASLNSPNLERDTKPYSDRVKEIQTYCKEKVDPSIEVKLNWEWNVKVNKWYPSIEVNWGGSEYNSVIFEIDYCFRILTGRDKDFINSCIGAAIKVFIMMK